jgi:hypothetical protein
MVACKVRMSDKYLHTRTSIYTYIHTYIHTYIYIYVYVYIYIYILLVIRMLIDVCYYDEDSLPEKHAYAMQLLVHTHTPCNQTLRL